MACPHQSIRRLVQPLGAAVKISQPVSVIPIECSNCAESDRSRVTAVQPSSSSFTCDLPRLIIGSIVKNMPGLQFRPGPGAGGVDHFGRIVEQPAQPMPAEFAHHAIAEAFGMFLDRRADVAQRAPGLACSIPSIRHS
jgi:hypothetical protein